MDAPAPIHLHAGQCHHAHLPAGTRLIVCSGRLRVTDAPRWLGEQVFQLHRTLDEGEVLHLDPGGWVTLSADADASFACEPPLGRALRLHDGSVQLEAWCRHAWRAHVESPLALLRARIHWLHTLHLRRLRIEVAALRERLER